MDDSYLPNPFNNKRTSPGYHYTNAGQKQAGSTIFTNQVNVDGSGQNILNDAANEPNIAVNPLNPNEIVIGWRQFDNVYSNFRQAGWGYSSNAGVSWIFPGVIEQGVFRSDPVLDYNKTGTFYYNSLTNTFATRVFISTNGGATWNTGTDAGGGDKQWMTIDRTNGIGSGNIYSSWSVFYSYCSTGIFTRSTDGGTTYETCTSVDGSPVWHSMAVGVNGELFVAGADTSTGNMLVVKSLNAQVPNSSIVWNAPVMVDLTGPLTGWMNINPEGLLGMASLDIDRSNGAGQGNVYVLASVTPLASFDPGDVMFSRSTDGGLTWSTAQRINDDASTSNTQWFGTMSVAPNGRIDAIWLDTRNGNGSDSSALYYSYSTDQGNTWSVNEKLSPLFDPHIGYPQQNKMGDYFDMVSDNGGVHLAWANTLNGEEDVYYSRIVPPVAQSTNEISGSDAISVFPNPTEGVLTVAGLQTRSQMEIYNLICERLFTATSIHTVERIDVSSFASGIYFLKITEPGGNSIIKKISKR